MLLTLNTVADWASMRGESSCCVVTRVSGRRSRKHRDHVTSRDACGSAGRVELEPDDPFSLSRDLVAGQQRVGEDLTRHQADRGDAADHAVDVRYWNRSVDPGDRLRRQILAGHHVASWNPGIDREHLDLVTLLVPQPCGRDHADDDEQDRRRPLAKAPRPGRQLHLPRRYGAAWSGARAIRAGSRLRLRSHRTTTVCR